VDPGNVPKAECGFDNNNGNIVNVLDAKMVVAPITSSRKPYLMVLFDTSSAGVVMMISHIIVHTKRDIKKLERAYI
jgi:hypothetical protein